MNDALWQEKQQKNLEYIEQVLSDKLPKNPSFQKTIMEAMDYSLMAGGKRIRPMLILSTYRMFGGKDLKEIEPFLAAMEMIHTYSLVHDDLPAMDNDDYRRGRKTTHIVYGEDMGILAGDALLNYAYEIAATAVVECENTKNAARALQILTNKAGVYGMVGGQVADVELTGKELSKEQLEFIYRLKTGALLEAAFMLGATLAGAGEKEIQIMEQIGYHVGMAFQIQDDILDVTSTTEELGKPVHSDEKNAKNTYVAIYGMEQAKKAVQEYSQKAIDLLSELSCQSEFLEIMINKLIHRKK